MTDGDYWHNCRPSLLEFGRRGPFYDSGVTQVLVEGITLLDSPFWTFSSRDGYGLVVRRVNVTTTGCGYGEAPNTDGFNIQGQNILIEHSSVRNGDDCVPIFPPTRNVTVRNISCECGNGLVPVVWPALSCASEGGNITDVLFDGAVLTRTSTGIAMKSLPMFVGNVERVLYQNIVMKGGEQGLMFNVFDQNEQGQTETWSALRLAPTPQRAGATYRDVTLINVTGSALKSGKITCSEALPCTGFMLDGVQIAVQDTSYKCSFVSGHAKDCDPPVTCLNSTT